MKLFIFAGIGFIHFIDAAQALVAAGNEVVVVSSVRHSPVKGISFVWCPVSRLVDLFERKVFRRKRSTVAWKVYGVEAALYWRRVARKCRASELPRALVRSGAGFGLIKMVKKYGAKVLVDHSIVHPSAFPVSLGPSFDARSSFWRQVERDCRSADMVLVNSQYVFDSFLAAGYSSDQVKVLPLGVDPMFYAGNLPLASASKCQQPPIRLLFTGRFCVRKGGGEIVRACEWLSEHAIAYTLDVVGDYSDASALAELCAQRRLPVRFHGPKARKELPRYLAAADIYLLPSYAEGCAQSGMEAMAAGLCVIATRESGLPITDGENGFVVPCGDATAIANRVIKLASDSGLRIACGESAARHIAANYTWRQYGEKLVRDFCTAAHGQPDLLREERVERDKVSHILHLSFN